MELTREKSLQLWQLLNSLSGQKTSAKGAYGISKNRRILEVEREAVIGAQKSQMAELNSPDFLAFDQAG